MEILITLRNRLITAIEDYNDGELLELNNSEDLADYLIEVIDELHVSDNSVDFDQKAEPRNPQVGEIWVSTK